MLEDWCEKIAGDGGSQSIFRAFRTYDRGDQKVCEPAIFFLIGGFFGMALFLCTQMKLECRYGRHEFGKIT